MKNQTYLNVCIVYLLNKKTLKRFGFGTWCAKKPFDYRVAHHLNTIKVLSRTIIIKKKKFKSTLQCINIE